jgi:hypothetical protein
LALRTRAAQALKNVKPFETRQLLLKQKPSVLSLGGENSI